MKSIRKDPIGLRINFNVVYKTVLYFLLFIDHYLISFTFSIDYLEQTDHIVIIFIFFDCVIDLGPYLLIVIYYFQLITLILITAQQPKRKIIDFSI